MLFTVLCGCATSTQMAPNLASRDTTDTPRESGRKKPPYVMPKERKKLLVFFDGTSNQWDSRTNVRRLFEMVGGQEDPLRLCFYVEGVGADYQAALGNALGQGMQKRIAKAYAFLSEYYSEGDEIYIFGFSRGAHQARALAGLISHCGLLKPSPELSERAHRWRATRMIDWSQKTCEGVNVAAWEEARKKCIPLYPEYLECDDQKLKDSFPEPTRYAEVRFVGVWDTVPGSSFKKFGPAEEMEDGKQGIRYRLGAYPPIHEIAHAVSIHERRKPFRPVLIPEPVPVSGRRTIVHEEWFAGAHSDVGGGYENSSELPGVTMNWMLGFLQTSGIFAAGTPKIHSDFAGMQHDQWSKGWKHIWPAENRWRPENAIIHPSVASRLALTNVIVEGGSGWSVSPPSIPPPGLRPSHWAGGTTINVASAIVSPGAATMVKSNEFLVMPWQPWNRTGFQLESGKRYRMAAVAEDDKNCNAFKDASISANPDGVFGFRGFLHDFFLRNPGFFNLAKRVGPGAVTRLRVLRDQTGKRATFLTLVGAVGMDDSCGNVFVIGKERVITAKKTGELVLFCNDWPGGCGKQGDARFSNSATYPNNTGIIRLKIEPLD